MKLVLTLLMAFVVVATAILLICLAGARLAGAGGHPADDRPGSLLGAADEISRISYAWEARRANADPDSPTRRAVEGVIGRFRDPEDLADLARLCQPFAGHPVFEWATGTCYDRLSAQTTSKAVGELRGLLPGAQGSQRVGIEERIWQQNQRARQRAGALGPRT